MLEELSNTLKATKSSLCQVRSAAQKKKRTRYTPSKEKLSQLVHDDTHLFQSEEERNSISEEEEQEFKFKLVHPKVPIPHDWTIEKRDRYIRWRRNLNYSNLKEVLNL